jgi:hypothetical protein
MSWRSSVFRTFPAADVCVSAGRGFWLVELRGLEPLAFSLREGLLHAPRNPRCISGRRPLTWAFDRRPVQQTPGSYPVSSVCLGEYVEDFWRPAARSHPRARLPRRGRSGVQTLLLTLPKRRRARWRPSASIQRGARLGAGSRPTVSWTMVPRTRFRVSPNAFSSRALGNAGTDQLDARSHQLPREFVLHTQHPTAQFVIGPDGAVQLYRGAAQLPTRADRR